MSIISTRSRYGLRLLMRLAEPGKEGPQDLHSLAEAEGIPEKYVSKLAAQLVAARILRSVRGARGGYELARPAEDIDILSVVEVLEGRLSLVDCRGEGNAACPRAPGCGARELWSGLEEGMRSFLAARKLSSLVPRRGEPEYFI